MTRAAALLALVVATTAMANPSPVPRDVRRALARATVVVLPARCGGVFLESTQVVATALHCVNEGPVHRVRLPDGVEHEARVAVTDVAADQALLTLAEPVPMSPLHLARRPPIRGTVLYFAGNPERPRPQDSRLDKIGRCESLPDLDDALFTSIDGTPGDSGSPLVDGAAQVVGLVHGGARCHIATPASTLAPMLDRVLRRG